MVGRTCRGKADGRSEERLGSVTWAGQQLGGGGGGGESNHCTLLNTNLTTAPSPPS